MYQVLYRKYRPKVFADVYGQEHVTSTLKNEIKEGRIAHAYLFTGSRGTGKTTCAKILAKAVNCENSVDGEPCNECEVCKGLDNGTIYDVVEIDAASNNGVDNIRDLREEANYTPSRGKYRVYIIDEVHMLSTGAFNALLKTLEEPPAHVIFILATTEVHKLPATILSRCQRFDFKRIQPETMSIRLKQVAGGVKGSLRAKLGAEPRGQTVQLAGGAQHKAVLQAGRGAFAQDGGRSAGSQVDLGQLGGALHQRLQRKLRPGQDHAAHQLLLLVDRHHGDGRVGRNDHQRPGTLCQSGNGTAQQFGTQLGRIVQPQLDAALQPRPHGQDACLA